MYTKSVSYGKSYEIFPGLWEKIGIEIECTDIDDRMKALQMAKDTIEAFHKLHNPKSPIVAVPDIIVDNGINLPEDEQLALLKTKVSEAPTKEDAMDIINNSGNWKIALQFQTKDIVNSKPNK